MDFQPRLNKIVRNSVLAVAGVIIIMVLLNHSIRLNEDEFKLLALLAVLAVISILMFFWGWSFTVLKV
ncbi:MAG: hypothetical protein U9O97_05440 [Elusimicrobiota bacterium]|nr:hypothetical protein [Elusimicrobiota bacterium]